MVIETIAITLGAFVVAAVLTGVIRRAALVRGMLDIPNQRSSHQVPTPRGGGLAVVIAAFAGWFTASALGALPDNLLIALLGGIPVAFVGYLDDRRGLPARMRLVVHLAAAIWAVWWLGDLPPIQFGDATVETGLAGKVIALLGIVWTLNLFNFMDGIDGIAASEAIFVAAAGAGIAGLCGLSTSSMLVGLTLAAACGGFLPWNWPPARIFMGDVGSGFIGYAVGVLIVAGLREQPGAPFIALILAGVFFVDATVTLLRRLMRRERLAQAHRTHAYQWLARRWSSHRRVTLAVLATNVSWLLPLAAIASRHPSVAAWLLVAAWLPLLGLALWAGAGRRE